MKPRLEAEKPQGASEFMPGMRRTPLSEAEYKAELARSRATIRRLHLGLGGDSYRDFLRANSPSWRRGMP